MPCASVRMSVASEALSPGSSPLPLVRHSQKDVLARDRGLHLWQTERHFSFPVICGETVGEAASPAILLP